MESPGLGGEGFDARDILRLSAREGGSKAVLRCEKKRDFGPPKQQSDA